MNSEAKIGFHEALALLVIILSAKNLLAFPRNMTLLGHSAGWIIVLLSGIVSLGGFFFLSALLRKYPGKNIIQIARQLGGGIIGRLIGILFFLFFLVSAAMYLRQFAESFILEILPLTPISVISGLFLIISVYAAILGIESLSRAAWLLSPYLLATIIVIVLFSLPQSTLTYFTPILGPGPLPLLKHSVLQLSIFSEIILLGIIAPLVRNREKIGRIGFYGLSAAIIFNASITALATAVFNYAALQKLPFPVYQLAMLIAYGEFIQRVESVFVFILFFRAGIQLSGLFYGTVTSFAETFGIKNYRPLTLPLAVLVFTISLIPASMTEALELNEYTATPSFISFFYSAVAFGIPLLLWLIAATKKRFGWRQ